MRLRRLEEMKRALNSLSRAEVERGVLYHAQAVLEDMGMEQEVELLAARVYGSRSRQDLYREDSDLMWFFPIKVIFEKIAFSMP